MNKVRGYVIAVLIVSLVESVQSQQDVAVRLDEPLINEALASVIEARGINFGKWIDHTFIEHSWFVNMESATCDVKDNNEFYVDGRARGSARFDLGLFTVNLTGTVDVRVRGIIENVVAENGTKLVVRFTRGGITGGDGIAILLQLFDPLAPYIADNHPKFEINLGTTLLPDALASLFTTPTPQLTTTESEIVLYYTVAGPRQVKVQNSLSNNNFVGNVEIQDGGTWYSYQSPRVNWWPLNSTNQIRAVHGAIPYQSQNWKFFSWEDLVTTNEVSVVANFDKTKTATFYPAISATVQTDLEGMGSNGQVFFAGQAKDSPYSDFIHMLPYYTSIGAPLSQTVNGIGWEFIDWNDGVADPTRNVSVQQPSTFTARYKAHTRSTTVFATTGSSQRKLARLKSQGSWGVHEAYYLVYESSGEIWLTESIDYGSNWSPEVRVSDGTGNFSAPSVAVVVRNGNSSATDGEEEGYVPADLQVYVVYRKQVGSQYQIISRIRVPGIGNTPLWFAPLVISQSGFTPTTLDVRPIIAYHTTYGYEQLIAAWEATDGIRQRTASNSNNTWYWGATDGYFMLANVPGCKNPSVSNKHGNGLHQLWGALVYEGEVWAGPEGSALWPVTEKGDYTNSRNPSVAFDAVGRVHLSWVAYDNSRGMDVVVHRSSDDPYTPNWSPFYVIVDDFGNPSQLTTSVLAHDDEADGGVSVEWADGLNFVFANHAPDGVNFKDWRWASFGSYVVSPNASHISRPDYDFAVLTLNTQPLSTITNVTFGMPYGPNGPPASPTSSRSKSKLYRSILLRDTTVRSQVRLQLGDIVLTRGNDTINSQLWFEKTRDREGQSFIRSECFRVNQQNVKARFGWEAVGNNLRHRLTVAVNLVDSATGSVIERLNDYSISENRRIEVRRNLNENLPVRAAPMYIAMSIQGLPESMYKPSLANIEEIQLRDTTASNLTKRNAAAFSNSKTPTSFALHNARPNPFNPSAQINFDLPEPSRVSLVIYDVLGRKVAELVDGLKEAGYHSAVWNANEVASGVYFARFAATDPSGNLKLSKVNKLLLAK
jgi:hypothetical protein